MILKKLIRWAHELVSSGKATTRGGPGNHKKNGGTEEQCQGFPRGTGVFREAEASVPEEGQWEVMNQKCRLGWVAESLQAW